jgi:hypothetical protein
MLQRSHAGYIDWPKAAREMITVQEPKFAPMTIGINDRKQIREAAQTIGGEAAQMGGRFGGPY